MLGNPPKQAAARWPFGPRDTVAGALLLVAVLICYLPAINGGFVFDDDRNITPDALASLRGLWLIWSQPGASFQYYPALHTAFWIEHRLWGDTTWCYHLMNLLQHTASACLLVAIMRKLSLPGAWLAAFIFALHPVCVESAAWISEQKNTLSTLFFLASALAWLHFDGSRRARWYFLASALFLMAVLGKTTAATLPAALLVLAWWQRGRIDWKRDALPLLPWFAAGGALDLLSGSIERKGFDPVSSDFSLSFPQHILLASREVWFYAVKLLWPANLMFNYPRWRVDASAWWQWLFPAGLLALAAGLCLLARRNRGPLAGFLFFTGNLVPVMGFFYIGWFRFSFVADHFQYVAGLGIIVPVSSGLALAARKINTAALLLASRAAAGIMLAALGALTWRQCGMYQDMRTLFQRTVESNPESGMAHYDYGLELAKIPGRLTEAMEQMKEALRLRPNDVKMSDLIASDFLKTPGWEDEALPVLEQSLKSDPNDAYAHYLLGSALLGVTDRTNEAITHLEAAARLNPGEIQTHEALANALVAVGRPQDAIPQYEAALKLKPDMAEAHYLLANALAATPGRAMDAVEQYRETLQLNPGFAEGHFMLARILSTMPDRKEEAIVEYEESLRLNPNLTQARQRLRQLRSGK